MLTQSLLPRTRGKKKVMTLEEILKIEAADNAADEAARKQFVAANKRNSKLLNKGDLCEKCKEKQGSSLHTCPYAEEIHGDDKTTCNCCDDCVEQCCMDI